MLALALVLSTSAPATTADVFEKPFRLMDARRWIDIDGGMAAPLVADFDGDRLPDLLVGQFGEGKLRIYRNRGSANEPRFEGFTWFKTGEQDGKVPVG
jgi:hypothetical protein